MLTTVTQYQALVDNSVRLRSAIRVLLGTYNQARRNVVPITVLPPGETVGMVGQRGGHFTAGGARIAHPSAYAKRGWSNMRYKCSTLCIHVTPAWLCEHIPAELLRACAPPSRRALTNALVPVTDDMIHAALAALCQTRVVTEP